MADFLLELPVGGRDDADVDLDVVRPADALEGLLFEKAEQLGLQRRHHFRDLIEKDGSTLGGLEEAALLQARVGERAALVSEQLALQQRTREAPNR